MTTHRTGRGRKIAEAHAQRRAALGEPLLSPKFTKAATGFVPRDGEDDPLPGASQLPRLDGATDRLSDLRAELAVALLARHEITRETGGEIYGHRMHRAYNYATTRINVLQDEIDREIERCAPA